MVNGLELAKRFHETYERLAPRFGYETRADSDLDAESPNGRLMVAVCQEIGDAIEKSAFEVGFQVGLRERRID